MASEPDVIWKGASGAGYGYWVHGIPTSINPGQDGNYIYAKKDAQGLWQPIYIGQGDLKARTDIDNHHQSRCLKAHGATHVHVHTSGREAERLAEEQDLLSNYTQAYQPVGCNEKPGG